MDPLNLDCQGFGYDRQATVSLRGNFIPDPNCKLFEPIADIMQERNSRQWL